MDAERLAQIQQWDATAVRDAGRGVPMSNAEWRGNQHRAELLTYVHELTRQLDDARDKAINAGIFTSSDGDESKYTHERNTDTCERCGMHLVQGYCYRCETEISTPGATSYKP